MNNLNCRSEKAWVAVGDAANWERGFENGIWGIVPQLENHWQKMKSGDLVLFYQILAEDHGRKPVGESVPLK